MEKWEDVKEYEGIYQISSYGRLRSLDRNIIIGNYSKQVKGKILTGEKIWSGYVRYNLWKNNKCKRMFAHRLVAGAFIIKPTGKTQINHIDGNKQNNRIENLEWVTGSENQKHAHRIGIKKAVSGEKHYNSTLKEEDVLMIKKLLKETILEQKEIAKIYGVKQSCISDIKRNKTWKQL